MDMWNKSHAFGKHPIWRVIPFQDKLSWLFILHRHPNKTYIHFPFLFIFTGCRFPGESWADYWCDSYVWCPARSVVMHSWPLQVKLTSSPLVAGGGILCKHAERTEEISQGAAGGFFVWWWKIFLRSTWNETTEEVIRIRVQYHVYSTFVAIRICFACWSAFSEQDLRFFVMFNNHKNLKKKCDPTCDCAAEHAN